MTTIPILVISKLTQGWLRRLEPHNNSWKAGRIGLWRLGCSCHGPPHTHRLFSSFWSCHNFTKSKITPENKQNVTKCWFSCWELWLLLHGDEEKRGLGWEEEKAPGTPMKKLWIQAHVQTQVQVLKCLLLQEQQRQDEDSGKVQRDRLAQLLTSKVYRVKSTFPFNFNIKMFFSNPYFSNTSGKARQPVQGDTRITKTPDAQPRVQWHQHQNERSDSTLMAKEEKLPKWCFCPKCRVAYDTLSGWVQKSFRRRPQKSDASLDEKNIFFFLPS